MKGKHTSKETILQAAEAVIAKAGAAHLTLEAVALQAGMSKGGVLYHYPTKEVLLVAMLTRLLELVDQDRAKHQAALSQEPGADLQADVLAGLQSNLDQKQVSAALLAAGASDFRLLDPVRAWQKRRFDGLVRSKQNPARAALIVLAVDGFWLNELLQTSPLNADERKQVLEDLMELAKSAA